MPKAGLPELARLRSTHCKTAYGREDEATVTDDIDSHAVRYGPLGLLSGHCSAAVGRRGRECQAGRADLAAGGAEGYGEAAEARAAFARVRIVHAGAAEHPNQVWSCDHVENRTHNGRRCPMIKVINEFTRECLAIWIGWNLKEIDVIDVLSDLFILRDVPGHIRSDNGLEFIDSAVQASVGARTAFIAPGSPWENGYRESFNAKLRDELLDGEIFYSVGEARGVVEGWRRHYNAVRPHLSLGYRPLAPEAVAPSARPPAQPRPAKAGALTMADTRHMN